MAIAEDKPPRKASPPASISRPRRRGISWSEINLALDTLLLVNFAGLCAVAAIVRFVFPPGPAAKGWLLWGLDYDAWAGIQFGLLAVLTLGILVHVMFHWSWVCNVLASRLSRDRRARVDEGLQTIYGVGLLIALLIVIGVPVAAAWLTIRGPA